jgi:hypothetical protein
VARKQVIVSDLTGTEADEQDAVRVVIRRGPGIIRPLALDALPAELQDIGDAPDIYLVEVKPYDPARPAQELLVSIKDLKKVAPEGNVDALLESATGLQGRPRGSRNT